MQKTIIGVWGTANVGKSMTIANLGRLIQTAGGVTTANITAEDYQAIFEYLGHNIGVQTYGDIGRVVREGLAFFLAGNCDVIVIASKGYGETVHRIGEFAGDNGYRIIWTTPFEVRDGLTGVSDIKAYGATHLLQVVNDLISGIV